MKGLVYVAVAISFLSVFSFNVNAASKSPSNVKKMIVTQEDVACVDMVYFNNAFKAAMEKDYILASQYPEPPTCIDLYPGTEVEGIFDTTQSKYLPLSFIQIKYMGRKYWIMKSRFD